MSDSIDEVKKLCQLAKKSPRFEDNCTKLSKLIDNYSNLPKQGSQEWLDCKNKANFLGGSSLYKAIQNPKSYAKNSKSFKGNKYTEWGIIFESVIQNLCEKKLRTKILCEDMGSVPHPDLPIFAYSMDGIGIVKNKIALFEFKCPLSRVPDGMIPIGYEYQVKSGLDTIRIADMGIYSEAVFRACSLKDLRTDKISDFHVSKPVPMREKRLSYGAIFFYAVGDHSSCDIHKKYNYHEFASNEDITDIIYAHKDKKVHVWESEIIMEGLDEVTLYEQICKFQQFCSKNDYHNIGMMCYKLMVVDFHVIRPENGFVSKFTDKITEALFHKKNYVSEEDQLAQDVLDLALG